MAQDMVLQLLDMLQQGTIGCITIGGMDITYSPDTDEWAIAHHGSHTPSMLYDDIYECSGVVLALIQ